MKNQTILNYYLKDIEYYHLANCDKRFNPNKWIDHSSKVAYDFAKYIEFLLNSIKKEQLTISEIPKLVCEFYYQCVSFHKIIIDEECKKNRALNQLFIDTKYEIDSLGNLDCNTSQKIIDSSINLILRPEQFYEEFKNLKKCNMDSIFLTDLIQHDTISDYLIRCIEINPDPDVIDIIIDNLSYQNDIRLYNNIEKYLNPQFPLNGDYEMVNIDIQSSALRYIRKVNSKERNEILKKYKNHIFKENQPELTVTSVLIESGFSGLKHLYQNTKNSDIKIEIIDCYNQIKSKEFAELLIEALKDETMLENGYYPVRNNAFFMLKEELFSNLIEWFGDDVLNIFTDTILEDD